MGTDGPLTQGGEAGKKWSDKGETTRAEVYPRENKKPHPGGGLKPGHGGGTGEGGTDPESWRENTADSENRVTLVA